MAYTYTLTSTSSQGGVSSSWTDARWNNYYQNGTNGATRRCGQSGSGASYYATYYMFDSSVLASLKNKTVTKIEFTVTVSSGDGVPSGTSQLYAIRAKANNTPGAGSSNAAWYGENSVLSYFNQSSATKSGNNWTFSLGTTVPSYGYTMGAYSAGYKQFIGFDSSATLKITTNETSYNYTLTYNANNGSGAPGNQTGSNVVVSPSYTFTISSTKPTRAGYEFLGWSTSSTATSASYSSGGSITVTQSGTTTLYAVWKLLATVRIVNSSSKLDTYRVYVVNSAGTGLDAYRVMIVNSAGTGLDTYT